MDVRLENYTSEELLRTASQVRGVILPLASVEILGAHGPVGLDLKVARAAAEAVAERAGCLAAPAVPYGDTLEFAGMVGTVHVPADVLESYLYPVARSLLTACRMPALIFLSVHSLDNIAAQAVCRRLKAEGLRAATADWWAAVGSAGADLLADPAVGRGHGSEMITSVALAVCPECVRMDRIIREQPKKGLAEVSRWNGTPFRTFGDFRDYCSSGAWGNAADATSEKGRELFRRGVESVASFIREAFPVPES